MQRQSLGSPSPKLLINGRPGASIEISSASPPPPSSPSILDDDDVKLEKLQHRRSSSPPLLRAGSEKFIHLIPILTLVCFLILFLCSHEPSPTELADFNGFRHPSEIAEFERGLDKGEMLGIGSLRNLQEIKRSHRKLGHF